MLVTLVCCYFFRNPKAFTKSSKKVKISGTGAAEIDLTQTSYSTIPSVDIELGNQCSDHSDKKMEKLADGLLRGINSYAKKYIHVAPLSSL